MPEQSSPGSGSLAGQVWTKCQLFPVHPHSDALAGAGRRSKGQDDNRRPGGIDPPAEYEHNTPASGQVFSFSLFSFMGPYFNTLEEPSCKENE